MIFIKFFFTAKIHSAAPDITIPHMVIIAYVEKDACG